MSVDSPWAQLESKIHDSSTKKRIEAIEEIGKQEEVPEFIILSLLKTYNYYQDSNSRNSINEVLIKLGQFETYLNFIKGELVHELAVSDYLTFLNWINTWIPKINLNDQFVNIYNKLIMKCASYKGKAMHRRRIYNSTISNSKMAIKKLNNSEYIELILRNKCLVIIGLTYEAIPGSHINKDKLTEIVNEFLLAKKLPSDSELEIFAPVMEIINVGDLVIEKAILRSSEVFTILPMLFKHVVKIPISVKFLNSIISGIKSNKEHIKIKAYETLKVALSKSDDDITGELLKNVKSNSGEVKSLIISSLEYVNVKISDLLPLTKEQNEMVLHSVAKILLTGFNDECISIFKTGFNSKLKRVWFIEYANDPKSIESFTAEFEKISDDLLKNPLSAATNKTLVCAFIILNLLNKQNEVLDESKLYSKLDDVDLIWFTKALKFNPTGWLFAISSKNYKIRLLAIDELKKKITPELSTAIINQIQDVSPYLTGLFSVLTQTGNKAEVESNLVKLIRLANDPIINLNGGWIGLIQRSEPRINVEELVSNNYETLFNACVEKLDVRGIADLAFIKPEKIDTIIELIESLEIKQFDQDEIDIYHGVDGELVKSIFKTKELDKNSKDYEIKKWEEEMKKNKTRKLTKEEQAQMNEQLKFESEIRKSVAENVNLSKFILNLILELAKQAKLVNNSQDKWFPIVIQKLWPMCKVSLYNAAPVYLKMSDLISPRLEVLKEFVGIATLRSYNIEIDEKYTQETLSKLITRLLYKIKILSDQSSLDLITLSYALPLLIKVLEDGKRIAIVNSKKGKVISEFVDEDDEEENLLLAIEIISSHSENFINPVIPRTQILETLILLLKLPSKAKIAKECFLSLCQYISDDISDGDLQLLYDNLMSSSVFVRSTILEGLDTEFQLDKYSKELYVCTFDNDENCKEIAQTIWEDNDLKTEGTTNLLSLFGNTDSGLRYSIAQAYANATTTVNLQELIDLYELKKNPPPPKKDKFGLIIKSTIDNKDRWEERSTIALALKLLPYGDVVQLFRFLVEAVGDKDELVRAEFQDAGIQAIKTYGSSNVESLIEIFEENLQSKNIKEPVIILYGYLATYLDKSDPRIKIIIDRLMKSLNSNVKFAVSQCLAPLVPAIEDIDATFDQLYNTLYTGKPSERRGAAFGISGLVKGSGIKALPDVIRNLTDASDDKDPIKRESVSITFQTLSKSLGKYFEPYVLEILPIILKSLGDSSPEVRLATDEAAKEIMKNTTSFGIKKLIPLAISNLDEIAWRSKKGSVELLGTMAYLDPTQLSSSLSIIIPEIVGVLNDTHKEVRKAAETALKRFGDVIRNPEIQVIVPDLINAIGDPTKFTDAALDKLIKTNFVHYIDGPSLALIIHVIHRGMRDRSAATKKKSCQIVGNMAILVDSKDLKPYLNELVGELEIAMVDPVPQTRSTAARALGSLVEKLGEDQFPGLITKLINTLQDETKSGDRLGSAQALSEVICGLGIDKLEELLPTILQFAQSSRNHIKAGFMPLLLFLPVCFGSQFSPYLNKIIPPILNGLADQDEEIRDTALRAGRLIVKNYAKKAIDLLLPELENGLSDSSYRIRLSSLELTGDLLFQITGISGKNELIEDVSVHKILIDVLGERRDKILAAIFICRNDVAGIVRNAAIDIWKALVANTPKTVKEILPSITNIVVTKLASDDETQRVIAAQTLGDMVRRVGANALPQLLPVLENASDKQGACIALTELIKSSSEEGLHTYKSTFISIIKNSLSESSAAIAFDELYSRLGKPVIDEIIPDLLSKIKDPSALQALQKIMSTKADVIFPILLPTLLKPPINSTAIASLATVAGSALYKRLSIIINTLVDSKSDAFDAVLLAVEDEGVHQLLQQLMALIKHENPEKREFVFSKLPSFFDSTNLDYSMYLEDIVSQMILSLSDPSSKVVEGAMLSLTALVKKQPKEVLERLVKPAKQALDLTYEIPAFKLPRGPQSILPIFIQGLMYGNSDQKESSALAIATIIEKTPSENLKSLSTTITGPLIRVVGEKVSTDIKSAILIALNNLLLKIPQFLRPFIPQLQRTFIRSLTDSNDKLRKHAVLALGTLIKHQPRVDSLITELVTNSKNISDKDIKGSLLQGMLVVVETSGNNLSDASKSSILGLVEEEIIDPISSAKLLGSLANVLSKEEVENVLQTKILNHQSKFSILAINSFLKYSPEIQIPVDFIVNFSNSENVYYSDNATVAIGKMLLNGINDERLYNQLAILIKSPPSNSPDTRRLALVVIRTVARKCDVPLNIVVPSIFASIRDPIIPIKLAAEKAYLEVFKIVEKDLELFNTYDADRSMTEYTKRVGLRLANVERERIASGGDEETLYSDRIEDENEIWQVGV
ncbi:unnamed protein product [Candida verbasci]|uniref:eIF-2-alpha kinase activator GCN1 n=1 Tax=Candida verbasci TaxID=1227364 RepID=A0A9W4XE78_9ASCO|nr:unnamed protein product [Candida verbasci]